MPHFTITYGRVKVSAPDPKEPNKKQRNQIEGGSFSGEFVSQEDAVAALRANVGGSDIEINVESISRKEA